MPTVRQIKYVSTSFGGHCLHPQWYKERKRNIQQGSSLYSNSERFLELDTLFGAGTHGPDGLNTWLKVTRKTHLTTLLPSERILAERVKRRDLSTNALIIGSVLYVPSLIVGLILNEGCGAVWLGIFPCTALPCFLHQDWLVSDLTPLFT